MHDDVIDNSDTRRGRPAAHRALEGAHRSTGWVGDAAAFGRSSAILLGDLLVAWSDDLLEEGLAAASPRMRPPRGREYAAMRREVTIGQFLDIAEESAFRTEPDERHAARALRVASLKSARYSVQQPLAIGGALAGADLAQAAALAAFGHPLGMAFQLRDDVLGVFGDERETGKPSGDDLREGKRTVLVAYAREALAPPARRIVDELIGDPDLDDGQIASLQRTIVETGALDRVEALISDYAREADRALSGARLGNAAVGELRDLARSRDGPRHLTARRSRARRERRAAQASACATRRTSLLRPARSASIGGMPMESSVAEQPVDRLVVGEAGVVEHEDRAPQRGDRCPSMRNTAGTLIAPSRRDPMSWNSSSMRRTRPSGSPSTSTSSGRDSQSVWIRGAESAVTKPLSHPNARCDARRSASTSSRHVSHISPSYNTS